MSGSSDAVGSSRSSTSGSFSTACKRHARALPRREAAVGPSQQLDEIAILGDAAIRSARSLQAVEIGENGSGSAEP
jgi:hypothetical protein